MNSRTHATMVETRMRCMKDAGHGIVCAMRRARRGRTLAASLITALFFALATTQDARAEMSEIHVAQQYGISYLPLLIMEEQKLIEKHAKAAGVSVSVSWAKFAGGNVMNDALLSNSLQFASGGVAPFLTLWGRTRGNLD